ncbi:hypothetical protein N781_09020 [Pontibacillus halophilus JSM 076056 = DSM 19796]|uniref:Uncharacterized protein n=1 Tax=Pontibacillus halophilus JSM 076056 = DSM 19796 TaxID=1385510 RepID=A0A0A5GCS9_9BACI|nr:hypothetical protein [Pontibacillus halophilus]KGX89849.1 hypothetical protein N781_09020 [Pontibacillus halophilus JSM 076056 = DSM 19796]
MNKEKKPMYYDGSGRLPNSVTKKGPEQAEGVDLTKEVRRNIGANPFRTP